MSMLITQAKQKATINVGGMRPIRGQLSVKRGRVAITLTGYTPAEGSALLRDTTTGTPGTVDWRQPWPSQEIREIARLHGVDGFAVELAPAPDLGCWFVLVGGDRVEVSA